MRLCWDTFRKEPAITTFDWLFTPNPNSPRWVAAQRWYRTSTQLSLRFILIGVRSSGFWSYPCDYRPFQTQCHAFATHFSLSLWILHWRIILATRANSLFRVSKRTSWSCNLLLVQIACAIFLRKRTFQTMNDYDQQISSSFNLRLRILFSFQSLYFFTIELQTYLKLALDWAAFPLPSREMVLFSWINFLVFLYAVITLYDPAFQQTSSQPTKLYQAPHLNCISTAIRFALFCFRSPLLTESHYFLFSPLT